jgi:hypothetical protein
MLWRSPRARVELDGWLEHFSAAELRETYAVLDGRLANPMPFVRRLRIGAVIVDRHRAIATLRTHGFELVFGTPAGSYLVRRASPTTQAGQSEGSSASIGRESAERRARK